MNHAIIFIGFPKSGKTTLGRRLAAQFGVQFLDTDEEVVKRTTFKSIRELVLSRGQDYFRALEHETLLDLKDFRGLLSTGGGLPLSLTNRALLKKMGRIVFLEVDKEALFLRMTDSQFPLPTYLDKYNLIDSFEKLIYSRKPIYESLADCKIQPFMEPEALWEAIHLVEPLNP